MSLNPFAPVNAYRLFVQHSIVLVRHLLESDHARQPLAQSFQPRSLRRFFNFSYEVFEVCRLALGLEHRPLEFVLIMSVVSGGDSTADAPPFNIPYS